MGRLVSLKNVDSIIKAYSKIHSDVTSLVIIGDGPERESLELLAEENNTEVILQADWREINFGHGTMSLMSLCC